MDLAAPHPLPLGRSRDWPRLVRDGTLLGFFVAQVMKQAAERGIKANPKLVNALLAHKLG